MGDESSNYYVYDELNNDFIYIDDKLAVVDRKYIDEMSPWDTSFLKFVRRDDKDGVKRLMKVVDLKKGEI